MPCRWSRLKEHRVSQPNGMPPAGLGHPIVKQDNLFLIVDPESSGVVAWQ